MLLVTNATYQKPKKDDEFGRNLMEKTIFRNIPL